MGAQIQPLIRFMCNGPRRYGDGGYLGHAGCGHDLTALFDKMPADGKEHEITCPKCSTVGTHRKTPPTPEA